VIEAVASLKHNPEVCALTVTTSPTAKTGAAKEKIPVPEAVVDATMNPFTNNRTVENAAAVPLIVVVEG
jgi:hypothetical protein